MGLSAFMVAHNSLVRGEPFVESISQLRRYVDEIVVIDLWSNDDTDKWMKKLDCKVFYTTRTDPYAMFTCCKNDMVLMIDPNEVIDIKLIEQILSYISDGIKNISIPRIEVTHNFQKISWHVHNVHRVWPNRWVKNWERRGVTTNKNDLKRMLTLNTQSGFLWAFTNNFLENWKQLTQHKNTNYLPPDYFMSPVSIDTEDYKACLKDEIWKRTTSPLNLPPIVRNLVGDSVYNPNKNLHKGVV